MLARTITINYPYSHLDLNLERNLLPPETDVSLLVISRKPVWVTQIFLEIDWNALHDLLRKQVEAGGSLAVVVKVHGYTIGTITSRVVRHLRCGFPLREKDLAHLQIRLLFVNACGTTSHTDLRNILAALMGRSFAVHLRGFIEEDRAIRRPQTLKSPAKDFHEQEIAKPESATLVHLDYYGRDLLYDEVTHVVYDPSDMRELGEYVEEHAVIVSQE